MKRIELNLRKASNGEKKSFQLCGFQCDEPGGFIDTFFKLSKIMANRNKSRTWSKPDEVTIVFHGNVLYNGTGRISVNYRTLIIHAIKWWVKTIKKIPTYKPWADRSRWQNLWPFTKITYRYRDGAGYENHQTAVGTRQRHSENKKSETDKRYIRGYQHAHSTDCHSTCAIVKIKPSCTRHHRRPA